MSAKMSVTCSQKVVTDVYILKSFLLLIRFKVYWTKFSKQALIVGTFIENFKRNNRVFHIEQLFELFFFSPEIHSLDWNYLNRIRGCVRDFSLKLLVCFLHIYKMTEEKRFLSVMMVMMNLIPTLLCEAEVLSKSNLSEVSLHSKSSFIDTSLSSNPSSQ